MNRAFILLVFVFAGYQAFGQPTITSFSPAKSAVGTTVTITGTNFSTTAANNIVYFGATRTPVNGATSTQITVQVPFGATNHPISVTVGGLTAYSADPFIVTFPGAGTLDGTNFAARVSFATGVDPADVATGDLDGNGVTDIVTPNNGSTTTASFFRNTSTFGSISYTAKSDLTVGSSPISTTMADIDGDGKLDVLTANYTANTITLMRNTGTSGTISFAANVNITSGQGPYDLTTADIDGDGKPEVLVVNYVANTFSIFRNTSTVGSFSFAARQDVSLTGGPVSICAGDLNEDGKPDVAIVYFFGATNKLTVLKNTSTPGTVSFDSQVEFNTGFEPRSVLVTDLDDDGKADVAITNGADGSMSIFRNTTSSGAISFATRLDVTTGNAPFSVTAGDLDGDGKPDLAVANFGSNSVSVFKNNSTSGTINLGGRIDFTTSNQPRSVVISDQDNDGKPDLVLAAFASDAFNVLRNTTKLGQTITFGALPTKNFGDAAFTVTATSSSGLPVLLSTNNASVATVSGTTITINGAGTANITATQAGNGVYGPAPNVVQSLTVNKIGQTITFNALPAKTYGDAAFALFGSSTSSLPLAFTSSNPAVASISGSTVTIVGAGSTDITAAQSGNTNYNPATSVTRTLVVNKANQTITFNALAAKTYGDGNFTLSATSSSGLPVTFTSSNVSVINLIGILVDIVGAGTSTITASQAGDANYNPATSVTQTQTVSKANQTITFGALAAKTFGDESFTLGAESSSGLGVTYTSSNTLVATISGNTVTIVGAGTTSITAAQPGNTNYNPATNISQALTVGRASQSIAFEALAPQNIGDPNFNLNATSSSGLPVSYTSSNPAVATISGSTVTIVGSGSTDITASQGGNANYEPAANATQVLVVKVGQTVTFPGLPAKTVGDSPFTISATASSGLPLVFTSSNTSVATVAGNTITIVAAGTTTITASQAGDATYNPALDVQQTLTVNKADQTIAFGPLADKLLTDTPFSLGGSSSSGLPVSYATTTSRVTIIGSQVTIVSAGRVTIEASQSGNATYNAAASVSQSFCIKPATPTVTLSNLNTATPTLTSNAAAGNQWYRDGTAITGATNTTYTVTQPGVYTVRVSIDDCLSNLSAQQPLVVTGDLGEPVADVVIYPNPSSDWLMISFGDQTGEKSVKIVDLTGREVLSKHTEASETKVFVGNQPGGTYILSVETERGIRQLRFVRQ